MTEVELCRDFIQHAIRLAAVRAIIRMANSREQQECFDVRFGDQTFRLYWQESTGITLYFYHDADMSDVFGGGLYSSFIDNLRDRRNDLAANAHLIHDLRAKIYLTALLAYEPPTQPINENVS